MEINMNKLKLALEKDELYNFLTGNKAEYYIACKYADMPTDPDQVFDTIKNYSNEHQGIWMDFQKTLIKLTENAEETWLSIYYLSMYLSYRNFKKSDFINLELVIKSIETGLSKSKEKLMTNKNWGGNQFDDGLWSDAIRLLTILNKKFSLNITTTYF